MVMSVYSAAAQSAAAGRIRAAHSLAFVETACWVFDKPSASSGCQLAKWLNNCAGYIQLYLQLHCLTPQHQCPTQRLSASALDSQWDLLQFRHCAAKKICCLCMPLRSGLRNVLLLVCLSRTTKSAQAGCLSSCSAVLVTTTADCAIK
jgi:hypothetical protein